MQLPALCEGDGAKLESSGSGKGQRANRFDLFFFFLASLFPWFCYERNGESGSVAIELSFEPSAAEQAANN